MDESENAREPRAESGRARRPPFSSGPSHTALFSPLRARHARGTRERPCRRPRGAPVASAALAKRRALPPQRHRAAAQCAAIVLMGAAMASIDGGPDCLALWRDVRSPCPSRCAAARTSALAQAASGRPLLPSHARGCCRQMRRALHCAGKRQRLSYRCDAAHPRVVADGARARLPHADARALRCVDRRRCPQRRVVCGHARTSLNAAVSHTPGLTVRQRKRSDTVR